MHANVIHQLVFGLERFDLSRAVLPEADVATLLGPTDVFHGDVRHQIVHGAVGLATASAGATWLIRVNPLANQLLFDALLSHVTEEGAGVVMRSHSHVQTYGTVLAVRVPSWSGYMMILVRSPEHLARHPQPPAQHVGRAMVLFMNPRKEYVPVPLALRVRVMQGPRHGSESCVLVVT